MKIITMYLIFVLILIGHAYGQEDYLNIYCQGPEAPPEPTYTYMIYSLTPTLSKLNFLCQSKGEPTEEVEYFLGQCGFVGCTTMSPHLYFVNVTALPLQTQIAIAMTSATITYPGNAKAPVPLGQCFGETSNRVECLSTLNQDSINCLQSKLNFTPQDEMCVSGWGYVIAGAIGVLIMCFICVIGVIYRYRDPIAEWCRPDDGYTLITMMESED